MGSKVSGLYCSKWEACVCFDTWINMISRLILRGACGSLPCFNRTGNSMQGYQALRVAVYILRNVFYFIKYILFYNSMWTWDG